MSEQYKQAGVDLEAGYDVVRRIKPHVHATKRKGSMGDIGSFGGLFDLSSLSYKKPVLVSGTDGVGTKLLIAIEMDKHDTIGIDLVAMSVNDVVVQGAEPLFFLDYIAVNKNNPAQIESIVKGVATGCQMANCSLIGGETAEMPDVYPVGHYDLAGYATGVIEKDEIIHTSQVQIGDIAIGLPSSGVHSNGFSLVRKIVHKDHQIPLSTYYAELQCTIGEALLTPTVIYVKPILSLLRQYQGHIHGIAHITGGGFYENIPRCLPNNMGITIEKKNLPQLPILTLLQQLGKLDDSTCFNVFNQGIGMVIIVDKNKSDYIFNTLLHEQQKPIWMGEVTSTLGVKIV